MPYQSTTLNWLFRRSTGAPPGDPLWGLEKRYKAARSTGVAATVLLNLRGVSLVELLRSLRSFANNVSVAVYGVLQLNTASSIKCNTRRHPACYVKTDNSGRVKTINVKQERLPTSHSRPRLATLSQNKTTAGNFFFFAADRL